MLTAPLWSEEQLAGLQVRDGFRQRGAEMTRLESLTDAAFALALTFLVISTQQVPQSYDELMHAFKGVPSFAASFVVLLLFWAAHVRWSRRYGLDDSTAVVLTGLLVLTVLIFVYPLKIMFANWFCYLSGGWLPLQVPIDILLQLRHLFIAYGIGFVLMSSMLYGLYAHARRRAAALGLNALERFDTDTWIGIWRLMAAVGALATLWPWLASDALAGIGAMAYFLLLAVLPLYRRRRRSLRRELLQRLDGAVA
jgi:hypothetical protein